jgi:hypothetical protein
VLF